MNGEITRVSPVLCVFMNNRFLILVAVLLAAAATAGCRCPSRGCVPSVAKKCCPVETTFAEEVVTDVSAVAACAVPLPTPGDEYQLLTEPDCQCTAAANSATGDMLLLEEHLACVFSECEGLKPHLNLSVQSDLLALYGAEKRGIAAAEAMVAFYRLAELEAAAPHLRRLITEAENAARRAKEMSESITGDFDPSGLDRQLLEVRGRLSETELQRLQLNGQLQRKLGCTLPVNSFFWPQVFPHVNAEPIDVDAAACVGLATRHDLRMIRLVKCELDNCTLPVGRAFLAAVDGALGAAKVSDGWINKLRCVCCSDHELPVRCRQLELLLDEAERSATIEIRMAAFKVLSQYQNITLAKSTLDSWKQRLRAVQAKRDLEDTTSLEIAKIQISVYLAEIELVNQIAELRLALLDLRRAQGLLPAECGFEPECCCNEGDVCQADSRESAS